MPRLSPLILTGLLVLALFNSSPAQSGDDTYHIRLPEFASPPKIDGRLENPFWEKGAVLDTFTQYEPQEGAAPSEKTIAYMGYDRNNLYIAVHCFDSNPKAIRSCLVQRDKVMGDDEVTVFLDTFNDKKRAFAFLVNPCGVQSDGIFTETRRRWRGMRGNFDQIDRNWDTYFLANAQSDETGYVVEMAIPFKSLRFPNSQTQVWGLQIKRTIRRKNEEIFWHPRSRSVNGFLIQTGTIAINGPLAKGKNIEIMPVFTALKQNEEKFDPEGALNLKYGVTSNLTADVTYNPDFSQIEADMPQVDVNQRYALYYPEKRPFFLEGKDYFDTPVELVYTRTIVNPDWGLKLTGKMGKTTLGLLSAFDATSPLISIYETEEEEDGPEMKSLVNVLRIKQDLFPESHIGFILTDKETGPSWNTISSDHNRTLGVDGHFKFNNHYQFSFQVLGSQSKVGDEKTDFVPATKFSFNRNTRRIRFSVDYDSIPEDFEASLGYIRRKDIRQIRSRFSYAFLPMKKWLIDIRPSIEYRRGYNFENTLTDEEIQLGWYASGWRGTRIFGGVTKEMERYNGVVFHKTNFRSSISSEPFSWLSGHIGLSFGDGIYYDDNPYLGYKATRSLTLNFRPLTNLRLFYSIRNNTFRDERGGQIVYAVNIISQRINLQLSRSLSFRLITDFNDYDNDLYNSILLSYVYRPGTVFYIGIDDSRERDAAGMFRRSGRYYFIKFSYWWRI
jgi:hypothetical protein